MHDLLSGAAREIVRTHWDGKQPTALTFLYANSTRLLGYVGGDNSNEILLGPVLAVGNAAGMVALLNLTTLEVSALGTDAVSSAGPHCPILVESCKSCRSDALHELLEAAFTVAVHLRVGRGPMCYPGWR